MGKQMDQDKLKALDAELAKDIKSEKDLGTLTQQLIKLALLTKSEPGSLSPSSLCHSVDQLPDWHSKHRHFVHRLHPCQRFTDLRIVISQAQFRADELFETIHRCLGF